MPIGTNHEINLLKEALRFDLEFPTAENKDVDTEIIKINPFQITCICFCPLILPIAHIKFLH